MYLHGLQTDNTTESDGRTIIAPVNTYGSDIVAIEDGVMKVTAVSNGTIVSDLIILTVMVMMHLQQKFLFPLIVQLKLQLV